MSARRREIVAFPSQEASKTGYDFTRTVSRSTLLSLLEIWDYIQRLNESQKWITKTLNASSLFSVGTGEFVVYLCKFGDPATFFLRFSPLFQCTGCACYWICVQLEVSLLTTVSHFSGFCKQVYLATAPGKILRIDTKFIWFKRALRV